MCDNNTVPPLHSTSHTPSKRHLVTLKLPTRITRLQLPHSFCLPCLSRFPQAQTWYQHEHRQIHDFPAEWVDGTLAEVALWNGAIAAVAGVIANVAAETLDFGPVAPFVLAVPFLAISGALIVWRWDENRSTTKVGLRRSCIEGLQCLLSDRKVLLLAAIQVLWRRSSESKVKVQPLQLLARAAAGIRASTRESSKGPPLEENRPILLCWTDVLEEVKVPPPCTTSRSNNRGSPVYITG